jgi:hypothetical protein
LNRQKKSTIFVFLFFRKKNKIKHLVVLTHEFFLISQEDLPTGDSGRWLLFSIIIIIRECVHSGMRWKTFGWMDECRLVFFLLLLAFVVCYNEVI